MLLDRNSSKIGVMASGASGSAPLLRQMVGLRHLTHLARLIGQVKAKWPTT